MPRPGFSWSSILELAYLTYRRGKRIMWTNLWLRLSLLSVILLLCGSAASAQQPVKPGSNAAADRGDPQAMDAQPIVEERRPEPYVQWMIRSMGIIGVLVLAAGAFSFVVTLLIVIRGQGPFASAALVLLVAMPLLIGSFGCVKSLISSFQVIALSDATIKASEISAGVTESLVNPLLGFLMMAPSYLVATLGSIVRSFLKSTAKENRDR